jgi:hypothetical protein
MTRPTTPPPLLHFLLPTHDALLKFGGESCLATFNRVGKTRAAVEMQGGRSFTCQVLLLLIMMMMMMPCWLGGDAHADALRFQSKITRCRLLLQQSAAAAVLSWALAGGGNSVSCGGL